MFIQLFYMIILIILSSLIFILIMALFDNNTKINHKANNIEKFIKKIMVFPFSILNTFWVCEACGVIRGDIVPCKCK